MADETTAVATPATASESTPANTTPDGLPTDAHFEQALAAALKDAGADPADIAIAEQAEAEKSGEIEPVKAEAKPEDEPAKKPEDEPAKEDKPGPGTLGKARRLWAEGKLEEALELALGVNIEKLEPTTKQWKAIKRQATEAKTVATQARQEAEHKVAEAKHVLNQVMPFVQGAQAYLKGDFATFLQLTTGDTPEAFQRKLISQLHDPPKTDPAVESRLAQIERDRAEERRQWQAEQERMQRENAQLQYQQATQQWMQGIADELKAVPTYAKVAAKPAFVQRVFALQQRAYNPRTQTTIDTAEAAEIVWAELYGDVVPEPAGGQTGSTQAPRVNGDSTARAGSTANKTTNLRPTVTEAAPELAEPWSPDRQEKILERYTRMAKSELQAP